VSGYSVARRLARREVVRRPWRSLLVLLLVSGPVMALTGFAVTARTEQQTFDQAFTSTWGDADLVVRPGVMRLLDGVTDDLPLPDTTSQISARQAQLRTRTDDARRSWTTVADFPIDDPMLRGLVDEVAGRVPEESGEVLLSTALANRFDVEIGDTLTLTRPSEATVEVVGTATWRDDLTREYLLVAPGDALLDELATNANTMVNDYELLDLGVDRLSPDLEAALEGLPIESRYADPPVDDNVQIALFWSWVGGAVAFVVVGVVIAAAFALTARRQLVLLGQLMGNGAGIPVLRATLVLQGSLLGLVGGIVGITAGVVVLALGQPLVETVVNHRIDAYDVRLGDLWPVLLLAVVAATISAAVPARAATRVSVLQAMAGRRPLDPYPARLVRWGAVAACAGLVVLAGAAAGATRARHDGNSSMPLFVLMGIAGSVAIVLGTCAMSPATVSQLEPVAARLRGTARLAARSIARQRSRTGALVAAIAVVAGAAVAGSTLWLTSEADSGNSFQATMPDDLVMIESCCNPETSLPTPPGPEVLDQVRLILPEATPLELPTAAVPGTGGDELPATGSVGEPIAQWSYLVVDDALADALDLATVVRTALDETGIVVAVDMFGHGSSQDDPSTATWALRSIDGTAEIEHVPVTVVAPEDLPPFGALITREQARSLGMEIVDGSVLVINPDPLSDAEVDRLSELRLDLWALDGSSDQNSVVNASLTFDDSTWKPSSTLVTSGIVAVATLLTLAVVAFGLALSAAETKDERDVLVSLGARPSTLRRLSGTKALVLTAFGCLIGIPLGYVPSAVVLYAAHDATFGPLDVVFPWTQVGLLLVVAPLVAGGVTLAASALAQRIRPVRASTMAFD